MTTIRMAITIKVTITTMTITLRITKTRIYKNVDCLPLLILRLTEDSKRPPSNRFACVQPWNCWSACHSLRGQHMQLGSLQTCRLWSYYALVAYMGNWAQSRYTMKTRVASRIITVMFLNAVAAAIAFASAAAAAAVVMFMVCVLYQSKTNQSSK